jgi:DNA-binding CsgD family transcriptional regulator
MSGRSHGTRSRGGKGGAEPRARIQLRELRVMEAILEGRSQAETAAALGISQPAESKIMRRLEERLLADIAWTVERQRARQSMRLEFLYREAVAAWQTSQEDGVRKRQRKSDSDAGTSVTIAELVSENRHGDPRYLDEARKALADLRTIWGLNAPEQFAVQAGTARFAGYTDDALEVLLATQMRLLNDARQREAPPIDQHGDHPEDGDAPPDQT